MARSSSIPAGQALDAALRAGRRFADTGAFDAWLKKSGLADRGWFLRSRLKSEFEKGVEIGSRKKVEGYDVWQSEPEVWRSSLDPESEFESYAEAARFTRAFARRRRNPPPRVGNPVCGGWKPVHAITDRAKRYRANSAGCKPPGPRRCHLCGARKNVDVHHLDGNEDHGRPENLLYACRSCNAAIGAAYKRQGIGKRTRQYNPAKVPSFAEYVAAVAAHRRGAWDKGGKVIHATPVDKRQEYAARIWDLRRKRGTDSQVPF